MLQEHFELFKTKTHKLGMKFFVGENRLRQMGDSLCCCGCDDLFRVNTFNCNHLLNGDKTEDIAFLITNSSGGSGTFYYVVAAVLEADGYRGTNAMLLGDRIAPQTTEFRNGEIIVNYADRKAGEPMTTPPSVGVSKYFKITNNRLVEIKK